MKIEKVSNGYIVDSKEVYKTIDEVFEKMLAKLEGRTDSFGGDSYGHVKVFRTPGETHKAPEEIEAS